MKDTVTAIFPGGIGAVEISKERALQIARLQKLIKRQRAMPNYECKIENDG
jgi:hypothetical protein